METLGGFPNLPALWLRRSKPAYAYAIGLSSFLGLMISLLAVVKDAGRNR
jgi:hypothetical protein